MLAKALVAEKAANREAYRLVKELKAKEAKEYPKAQRPHRRVL